MLPLLIDFDGTLHDERNIPPGKRMGPPVPGAVSTLKLLKKQGYEIIVFTVRAYGPAETIAVKKWLDYFSIPYDDVTNVKTNGIIIDNNALRFGGNWEQTYAAIQQLAPPEVR
jgi:phosphoglycolate phosphatase-like HAD superfamily hydrolase